jgi:hypothetical protein
VLAVSEHVDYGRPDDGGDRLTQGRFDILVRSTNVHGSTPHDMIAGDNHTCQERECTYSA